MYNIMQSSYDERMENDAFVRKQLQYHASRLLNLYTKYLLQSYHKNLNSKPQNLDYKKLALDVPILFNSKPTGTKYSFDNFHFAVVDELRYGRNSSDYPRAIIVRTLNRGKVIKRSVRPEDTIVLCTEVEIGKISSQEISELGN